MRNDRSTDLPVPARLAMICPHALRTAAVSLSLGAAALLLAGSAARNPAQGPPYSPEEALATFRLEPGFRIELVAAEPLISDPVAMEIDEDGRVYVVEMHGYPLDTRGSGRVMLLADTTGDGRADRSTVFADGLVLPTGIMRWRRGVLVTDSPDVWYLEDTDGDGRADRREVVLTGFALSNPQHNTNTPVYGLDNWIYLANEGPVRTIRYGELFGDEGSPVRFPAHPDAPTLPADAGGRNVRFRPDTRELEALSARSQFGQTFDEWGHHFLVTNNRHVYQEVVPARYLARNPALLVPNVVHHLPDYGNPAELFPVTENPEHQMLTDVGIMTSASGVTYYQGDLFPPAYRGAVFVAESAHNLVHASSVREQGVTFAAGRMQQGREFLASTDSWFRPVNFYLGPDGSLYLIDYYRKIIEHPEWLDDATAASADLYAGVDRGRIYRIVPEGAPAAPRLDRIRLGRGSTDELVRALESPNPWWRRHAQRLLVDRRPADAVAPLARMAEHGPSAVGRVHALWTLEGIGRLEPRLIERALADPEPGVRENAVRLAELHLRRAPALADRLVERAGDPHPRVRYQLLLTLGELDTPAAEAARTVLLLDAVEDEWMQIAALSAARGAPARLHADAVARLGDRETPGRRGLFSRLAALVAGGDGAGAGRLLRAATEPARPGAAWWRAATLQGLASGMRGDARAAVTEADRASLLELLLRGEAPPLRQAALALLEAVQLPAGADRADALRRAERVVGDPAADPALRADLLRLLSLDDAAGRVALLRRLAEPAEPAPVQQAAVRALGQLPGGTVTELALERWRRWTPAVREEAVRALTREPGRLAALVGAVEAGTVHPSEVDRPLRIRLMMVEDDDLRARARALFAGQSPSAAEAVSRYRETLTLRGDPARGARLFASSCSACHQYRGADGTPFGPDLGEVRNRMPQALIADIVSPNQSIADGYELWLVTRADGSSLAGVVSGETPTSITLRQPGGVETTVARRDIASMEMSDLSAMPEGLHAQLDPRAMADLIAFLKGSR